MKPRQFDRHLYSSRRSATRLSSACRISPTGDEAIVRLAKQGYRSILGRVVWSFVDGGTVMRGGLGAAAGAAVTKSGLGTVGGGLAGGIIGHEIGRD